MLKYIFPLLLPILLLSSNLRVASYNVQNLFDLRLDGNEYKEFIPYSHNWNREILDIKLNHISDVICDIDADIISLQEIENSSAFKLLRDRLKLVGCEYKYGAISENSKSAIEVAILSKYRLSNLRELDVKGERDILEVEANIDGHKVIIFSNHWKSKGRGGVERRRISSARVLKKRIEEIGDREFIILGDLNSRYDENLYIRGESAINDTLDSDKNLYNLWLDIKSSKRWSVNYYGNREAIDHIILPKSMFDGRGIDYINGSFNIFRAKYLFTKEGWINRWLYKKGRHQGVGYSDHLPIYAEFSSKPYRKAKPIEIKDLTIDELLKKESISRAIRLRGCRVISKKRDSAMVRDRGGREIYIYKMAKRLDIGKIYDLIIDDIKIYNGEMEITGIIDIKPSFSYNLSN